MMANPDTTPVFEFCPDSRSSARNYGLIVLWQKYFAKNSRQRWLHHYMSES